MKDEIVRKTKPLHKPSCRKPGDQEGHDGHKLSCSSAPDEIVETLPATALTVASLLQMQNVYLTM